jgi:DnaK suppressor protein
MTRTDRERFQAVLTAKREELSRAARRREGITIERTADALDETQLAAARELTTRGLEREAKLLRSVHISLDRIAEGSYGTCLECEEEISPKRLQALPWATLCITCQEHADWNSRGNAAYHQPMLKAA